MKNMNLYNITDEINENGDINNDCNGIDVNDYTAS